MEHNIQIFTLNCWGLKYPSITGFKNDRIARIKAIGHELAKRQFEIVCLQELWCNADYEVIRDMCKNNLKYSHYFHSGVLGSGICIFSKYKIRETFYHQWAVNGYVHKIFHGDWFGGKGVGLCMLDYKGINLYVYSAHLHAEYNSNFDEYKAHRILQAYDTAKFIEITSSGADVAIFAGDLNLYPDSLGFRLLTSKSGLKDSLSIFEGAPPHEGTNENPSNSYTAEAQLKIKPLGVRIDYILVKSSPSLELKVLEYFYPFPNRVPGAQFSYSDHEAVSIVLNIKQIDSPKETSLLDNAAIKESIKVLDDDLRRVKRNKKYFFILAILMVVAMISTVLVACLQFLIGLDIILWILFFVCSFILFFALIMATLWNWTESNSLIACQKEMLLSLDDDIINKTMDIELNSW